jgi:DNA (cytosine-5)-methyltransferase 1
MAKALGWGEPAAVWTTRKRRASAPERRHRPLDRPSYTVLSSSHAWKIARSAPGRGYSSSGGAGRRRREGRPPAACARHAERRSEARAGDGAHAEWPRRRPATTVLGDARVTAPGSWPRVGRRAELVRSRPLRVSAEQAAVLQGFRHDYPFQGSRKARFSQIGNAVCPPLAKQVLREAMRPSLRRRRSRSRGGAQEGRA